ncbi:GNAT family N-acetyltransferase [Chitinimonas naiadis]
MTVCTELAIRSASAADAQQIADIYRPYILESTISFEEAPVSATEIAERIAKVQETGLPWLVVEQDGKLLGYAYATLWRVRSAYRHSVETSVYLAASAQGRGLGSQLYRCLLDTLRASGLHTAIGGIAQPNAASVALHEKLGFRQVAMFEQVGWKFGRWIDVGYWQLHLNANPAQGDDDAPGH